LATISAASVRAVSALARRGSSHREVNARGAAQHHAPPSVEVHLDFCHVVPAETVVTTPRRHA
jgi:hypothetical protein